MQIAITTTCPYCATVNEHEIEFEILGKNATAVACYACDGFYAIISKLELETKVNILSNFSSTEF